MCFPNCDLFNKFIKIITHKIINKRLIFTLSYKINS